MFGFSHNAGKTKWVREEALASIVSIEMIDLPLADFEGSIEVELQNKDGKLLAVDFHSSCYYLIIHCYSNIVP